MIDGATPAPGVDVAGGVDRLLAASPGLEAGFTLADKNWKQFNDNLRTLDSLRDPVLSALTHMLGALAATDVRLTSAGFQGLEDLRHDAALAEKLIDAIQTTWPTNVDRDAFDRDVAKAIDISRPKREDVDRWLRIVADNAYRRNESVAAGAELRKRLAETIDLITHGRVSPDEAGAFESASREARNTLADLEATAFTRRTLADGTFAAKLGQAQNRIESLRRFYHPQGPDEWLDALPSVATASGRVNAYWESWRKSLGEGLAKMVGDHALFAARQQATERLRTILDSLDRGFPPAPQIPNEVFMAAARDRREKAIGQLLEKIDPRDPKIDPPMLAASQEQYGQWATNLVGLSEDFPITREILGPDDHPDQKWKDKPDFWLDPTVQELIKTDVARLNQLAALDRASREEWVAAINGGGAVEVALKAWRMLASDRVHPAWPSTPDELAMECRFRQRLAASFKALKDPREAETALRDLAAAAPVQWRRYVRNASSEAMLQMAWKSRLAMGIDTAQIVKLSPAARYNLFLSCLHDAIKAGDDSSATEAIDGLAPAIANLPDQPSVAGLARRIARLSGPEAFADRKPEDVFTLALPGGARAMQFKRVEPPAARPFYLCITSVSVSQFIAIVDGADAWAQARQLPWPYEPGKPDLRRGPRTWEWVGSKIGVPALWLTPDVYNDYVPALRAGHKFNRMVLGDDVGGNPSPEHPIQYISAETALYVAGLCGCRLPTSAEWQAAWSEYEKALPPVRWNSAMRRGTPSARTLPAGPRAAGPTKGSSRLPGIHRPLGATPPLDRATTAFSFSNLSPRRAASSSAISSATSRNSRVTSPKTLKPGPTARPPMESTNLRPWRGIRCSSSAVRPCRRRRFRSTNRWRSPGSTKATPTSVCAWRSRPPPAHWPKK